MKRASLQSVGYSVLSPGSGCLLISFLLWTGVTTPIMGQAGEGASIQASGISIIPTLDQIRDLSEIERKGVRKLLLQERQSIKTNNTHAQRERLRRQLMESIAGQSNPNAPIDIEESLKVSVLNEEKELEVARMVDRTASKVRLDIRDLRDLAGLIGQHGLSDRAASGLNQSRALIYEESRHVLMTEGRNLAVLFPADKSLEEELSLDRMGIVPPFVFSSEFSCEVVPVGGDIHAILGRQSGILVFEVQVDAQRGFRMQSRKHFEADGRTVGWSRVYGDYEKIEGVWVPGRVVEQSARDDVADYRTTLYTTLSAQINPSIPVSYFTIPENYRIQDIRPQ